MSEFPKMLFCEAGKKGSSAVKSHKHSAGYCVVNSDAEQSAAVKNGYRESLEVAKKTTKKKTKKKVK